jgi:hypothetical protein
VKLSADLFSPAVARSTDPQTSHDAAKAVTPKTGTIRQLVAAFALMRPDGFIDEELSDHFGDSEHSSYRTRRAELAAAKYILDSGRTRPNSGGLQCVVWVHRMHVSDAPPIEEPRTRYRADRAEVDRLLRELDAAAPMLRGYGFTGMETVVRDAAQMLRALTS